MEAKVKAKALASGIHFQSCCFLCTAVSRRHLQSRPDWHIPRMRCIYCKWRVLHIRHATDIVKHLTCVTVSESDTFIGSGDSTFAVVGPRLWNSLPVQLHNLDIVTDGLFRWQLKGHLLVNHEHSALWRLMCGTLEHLLTYSHPLHMITCRQADYSAHYTQTVGPVLSLVFVHHSVVCLSHIIVQTALPLQLLLPYHCWIAYSPNHART